MADMEELRESISQLTPEEVAELNLIKKEDQEKDFQKRDQMYDLAFQKRDGILNDPKKLLEIEDEKTREFVAKKVLGKHLDEIVFENEEESIDRKVAAKVSKGLADARVQDRITSIINEMPKDAQEQFHEVFKDFTEGKVITPENVDRYIRASISEVMPKDQQTPFASLGSGKSVSQAPLQQQLSEKELSKIEELAGIKIKRN